MNQLAQVKAAGNLKDSLTRFLDRPYFVSKEPTDNQPPFTGRILEMIFWLISLLDDDPETPKNLRRLKLDFISPSDLTELLKQVTEAVIKAEARKNNFKNSAKHLRNSLTAWGVVEVSREEFADGFEEYVFALFQYEKEVSGVDYLKEECENMEARLDSEKSSQISKEEAESNAFKIYTVSEVSSSQEGTTVGEFVKSGQFRNSVISKNSESKAYKNHSSSPAKDGKMDPETANNLLVKKEPIIFRKSLDDFFTNCEDWISSPKRPEDLVLIRSQGLSSLGGSNQLSSIKKTGFKSEEKKKSGTFSITMFEGKDSNTKDSSKLDSSSILLGDEYQNKVVSGLMKDVLVVEKDKTCEARLDSLESVLLDSEEKKNVKIKEVLENLQLGKPLKTSVEERLDRLETILLNIGRKISEDRESQKWDLQHLSKIRFDSLEESLIPNNSMKKKKKARIVSWGLVLCEKDYNLTEFKISPIRQKSGTSDWKQSAEEQPSSSTRLSPKGRFDTLSSEGKSRKKKKRFGTRIFSKKTLKVKTESNFLRRQTKSIANILKPLKASLFSKKYSQSTKY